LALSFLGTSLGAALLNVNVWLLSVLGSAVYASTLLVIGFLPNDAPGGYPERESSRVNTTSLRRVQPDEDTSSEETGLLEPRVPIEAATPRNGIANAILRALTVDLFPAFILLFEVCRDPLSGVTMLIFLLNTIGMGVRITFQQWASKTFAWTIADTNVIQAFEMLVSMLVLLALPFLTARFFRPLAKDTRQVDLWVIKISLLANIAGITFVGLAPSRAIHVISLTVYNIGTGLEDALRSFATSALKDEESTRKLYMGISIVEGLASVVGTPIWAAIFSATIQLENARLLQGIPFFAASSCFVATLALTTLLQRYVLKHGAQLCQNGL
jgi:hypothetical protein